MLFLVLFGVGGVGFWRFWGLGFWLAVFLGRFWFLSSKRGNVVGVQSGPP